MAYGSIPRNAIAAVAGSGRHHVPLVEAAWMGGARRDSLRQVTSSCRLSGIGPFLCGCSGGRITPFLSLELEWIEATTIDAVKWLQKGNPLWVLPTKDFAPQHYGPLFLTLTGPFPGSMASASAF